MKNNAIYLTGIGHAGGAGIDGKSITGEPRAITLDTMEKMRWSTHFTKPCDSFRRMDLPSRYAVAAAEMLGLPELEPDTFRSDVSIVAGTRFGCFGVDAEFFHSMFRPEGASPMLFTYTLPNVPLGELAIRHAITGQNLLLQAGAESGLLALWEAFRLIERRETAACLVIATDAVPNAVAGPLEAHLGIENREIGQAFAFYMASGDHLDQGHPFILAEIQKTGSGTNQQTDTAPESVLPALYQYLSEDTEAHDPLVLPAPESLKVSGNLICFKAAGPK